MTRKPYYVEPTTEVELITSLGTELLLRGYHAGNANLIAVSTDYSSIIWQVLRHQLSHEGEIADGVGIDVPYPDQIWGDDWEDAIMTEITPIAFVGKALILLEAGIIRGSNYTNLVELLRYRVPGRTIVTTTLFENKHSKFKSDIVMRYYDDTTQDLTFWWERPNNHWPT
jgi:hypothetical protein